LRAALRGVLLHQPHEALAYLRGVLAGSCHGVHPLNEWALRQSRRGSRRANPRNSSLRRRPTRIRDQHHYDAGPTACCT
jgi:hypothetical protein